MFIFPLNRANSFFEAPNARQRLLVDQRMALYIFSYFRVMPEILDFLFAFGRQLHLQDFHFSAFKQRSYYSKSRKSQSLPDLGRSDQVVEMCYNLKTIEKTTGIWPWSPRQTLVYHSFDVGNGLSNWLIVKADSLMRSRFNSIRDSIHLDDRDLLKRRNQVFAWSLLLHRLVCEWCGENWRQYINYLEDEFNKSSKSIVSEEVKRHPEPVSKPLPVATISALGADTLMPYRRRIRSAPRQALGMVPMLANQAHWAAVADPEDPPADPPELPPHIIAEKQSSSAERAQSEFTFPDLQRIQYIQEKVNESLLLLKSNLQILTSLKQFYISLMKAEDLPEALRENCQEVLAVFDERVAMVERELSMHVARVETLLQMIEARKNLVSLAYLKQQSTRKLTCA